MTGSGDMFMYEGGTRQLTKSCLKIRRRENGEKRATEGVNLIYVKCMLV
jgi:hypothetical protein